MKRLITCLLLLAMVLSAASCTKRTAKNSPEETFSTKDVSITLTTGFRQIKTNDYTACFEASDVTVYMIKEAFEDLTEEQSDLSVANYAELVRANNISKNPGTVTTTDDGLVYFEYTYQDPNDDTAYKTFTSMYKSTNAFWTVQFCCEEEIYADYIELFKQWGLSVFFTLKDKDYTIGEFMITLSEGFEETDLTEFKKSNLIASGKNEELYANYTSDDGKVTINFKKELKSKSNSSSLTAYTNEVYSRFYDQAGIGNLKNLTDLTKADGLTSFEFDFTQTIQNPDNPQQDTKAAYKYFVICFEGTKSYWTVEFACLKTDFANYRASFVEWAQSMTTEIG